MAHARQTSLLTFWPTVIAIIIIRRSATSLSIEPFLMVGMYWNAQRDLYIAMYVGIGQ